MREALSLAYGPAGRVRKHRTLYLIGPRYFLAWYRLLLVLLPTIVPISAVAVMGAKSISGGATLVDVLISGISVAFTVAVQLVFWFTLVFAIVERTGTRPGELDKPWTPDDAQVLD